MHKLNKFFVILILFPFFFLFGIGGCSKQNVQQNEADGTIVQPITSEIEIEGQMVVHVSERTAVELEEGSITLPEGCTLRPALSGDPAFEERHRKAGLHRWYFAEFDEITSQTKAAGILDGIADYIETIPGASANAAGPFNDPSFAYQWHLLNDGRIVNGAVNGADINVLPVWENFTAGSKEVIVGVVDTGVQHDHPDLNGIVIPPGPEGSKSFLNTNSSHPYEYTPQRHGTHVAGVIAAINNNGTGGCGIAGGNDGTGGVYILDCQAIGSEEGESGDIYSAIVWAADHGAVILNNSWNLKYNSENDVPDSTPFFYRTAIDYFINYAGIDASGRQTGPMKGGIVFFSAGNNSWQKSQPSMYEKVIAVGATGPAGEASSFSNYGDWVDICAPGGNYSPYGSYNAIIYSTVSGNGYAQMQGTSQACPMASGVAALLVSQYGGEGFTNSELSEMLLGGTNREISHSRAIGPALDAHEAMVWKSRTMETTDDLAVGINGTSVTLEWTAKSCGNSEAYYAYKSAITEKKGNLESFSPFELPANVRTRNNPNPKPGSTQRAIFYQLDSCTDYYACTFGYTKSHQYTKNNQIIKFRINGSPSLKWTNPAPIALKPGLQAELTVNYSDPDGDGLEVKVNPGSSAFTWTDDGDGTLSITIKNYSCPPGDYTATISASDYGKTAVLEIPYTILSNHAPQLRNHIAYDNTIQSPGTLELNLDDCFYDPDGDPLTYDFSCEGDVAQCSIQGDLLKIELLSHPGVARIRLTASDSYVETGTDFLIQVSTGGKVADIYPAIASEKIDVFGTFKGKAHIQMISSAGKTVRESDFLCDKGGVMQSLDVSDLPPGRYTVVIQNDKDTDKYTIVKI